MVQQDIGTARSIGAGVIADHGVKAERRLYRFAFKPAIEQRPCRLGEQVKHVTLPLDRQARKLATLKRSVDQGLNAVAHIGRRFHCKVAQHIGDDF